MSRKIWLAVGLACAASLVAGGPKGTVPRSAAYRYPAHTESNGVGIGAALLTPDQVRHTFASDVNRCCRVVEVALYPPKDKPVEVSPDDFSLRVTGTDLAAKPSSAKLLAAMLQKKTRSQRDVTVSPTFGVGYESGARYDPITGERRGGGVYTQAGVGVGVGGPGAQPAATDRDRDTMELELSEQGLPEGAASAPVAGYLYFPLSSKKKHTTHQLEYTLNGNKVVLPLP
jgi:hypothetical protein